MILKLEHRDLGMLEDSGCTHRSEEVRKERTHIGKNHFAF